MNRLNIRDLEDIARSFVWDYCNKNQIALIHTPSEPTTISIGKVVFSTGKIQPTGNMSGILIDNQIDFSFFNHPDKLKNGSYVFYCNVQYLFSFKTGGFEWKQLNFAVLVNITNDKKEYKSFCDKEVFETIKNTWG